MRRGGTYFHVVAVGLVLTAFLGTAHLSAIVNSDYLRGKNDHSSSQWERALEDPVMRGVETLDPDVDRTIPEMLIARGYPCEVHEVQTKDGYIMDLFHIPHGKNETAQEGVQKPVVLMMHGLLDTAITWILNMEEQSLGYILADKGYDVWLGNNRGNKYGKKHATLDVDSTEFWKFSFAEMGKYDVPAIVSYVREHSNNEKINYIGHSEGTLQMFIQMMLNSTFPDDNLVSFTGFGPVTSVNHMENKVLSLMAHWHADKFIGLFGKKQFMPSPTTMKAIFPRVCDIFPRICASVCESICGPHHGAFNDSRMAVVAAQLPGGTSIQNVVHFIQLVNYKPEDTVPFFDYGKKGNMDHYEQEEPPKLNKEKLRSVSIPMFMASGLNDVLADPHDVNVLMSYLPSDTQHQVVDDYAHLDFTWAIDAHKRLYPNVATFLEKHNPTK